MKKPVVYLVDASVARTGALVCARNIARAVSDRAHVVLVLPEQAVLDASDAADFRAVLRLPIRPLRRSLWSIIAYLPWLILASTRLREAMRKDGANLLLVNDFHLMHGALVRLLGYRGRILTWVRINPAAFGPVAPLWIWSASRSSDCVVAVSRFIQARLPGVQTELLYDAADPVDVMPAKLNAGDRTFVFLGNYIPGKGQDVAIDALGLISSAWPQTRLQFQGTDMGLDKNRAYRMSLEAQARRLGLHDRVGFGDFVPEPSAVLSGRFAALNLSCSESFSMTVLEAAAAGLAVIATRSGGPEEIILEGQTGILIPVGDAAACAEAMARLCREPELAIRMGRAGRERTMQLFSQDAFRKRLIELLKLGGIDRESGEPCAV